MNAPSSEHAKNPWLWSSTLLSLIEKAFSRKKKKELSKHLKEKSKRRDKKLFFTLI